MAPGILEQKSEADQVAEIEAQLSKLLGSVAFLSKEVYDQRESFASSLHEMKHSVFECVREVVDHEIGNLPSRGMTPDDGDGGHDHVLDAMVL
jgi:hypothetical protein